MLLLGIETSCDDTATALVRDGRDVLASVSTNQDAFHAKYGGIVPEIASRQHVALLSAAIEDALGRAGARFAELDGIAVTYGPGLIGSLVVGVAAAKALAFALDKPLFAINHLHGHVFAAFLDRAEPPSFPFLALLVSGGHSQVVAVDSPARMTVLGRTRDDAAGEAYDKTARLLGFGYPGGPAIEQAARAGNAQAFRFPRSFIHDRQRLAFSFSGLKTAVRYTIAPPGLEPPERLAPELVADLAASFQEAVVDVLVGKCRHALESTGLSVLAIGGGVAANARLAERFQQAAQQHAFRLYIAPRQLCTDNAVMGAIAVERWRAGLIEALDLDVTPGLVR